MRQYSTLSSLAPMVASVTQIPAKEIAKTVMVKIDGDLATAILPASQGGDLELLEIALDADRVRLAGESEFRKTFPDC